VISVEQATHHVLDGVQPLTSEVVSVADALGRVLAADVSARVSQPWAAVSAMDGYAVRAADVAAIPARLRVVGAAPAGGAYDRLVGAGEAVRIFTGAPLPDGSDTIVIQEDTEAESGPDGPVVRVLAPAERGRFVRPAGLDFAAGDTLLKAGRLLTSRDVGLAAAMNVPWLTVRRRPSVALLATGDEIVRPGEPLGPNQIVSANTIGLAALVRACGAIPRDLGIAGDDPGSLTALAAGARGADVLVTTGGASVGEHDLVRQVLGQSGLELGFWKIAMRPGKPLMFGRMDGVRVLGLPGNPVSAMVCGMLYLRPLLRALCGLEADTPPMAAELGRDLPANDRRQDYLRATLVDRDGRTPLAKPFDLQDSAMLRSLAMADALIVRAPHAPSAKAGDIVPVLTFPGGCERL
jgi:molybdopterin molybdotransferase